MEQGGYHPTRYESELEEKKKKYRENHPGMEDVTETEDEQNLFYRSLIGNTQSITVSHFLSHLSTIINRYLFSLSLS